MSDLTVSSAVDAFMESSNQADMLTTLEIKKVSGIISIGDIPAQSSGAQSFSLTGVLSTSVAFASFSLGNVPVGQQSVQCTSGFVTINLVNADPISTHNVDGSLIEFVVFI